MVRWSRAHWHTHSRCRQWASDEKEYFDIAPCPYPVTCDDDDDPRAFWCIHKFRYQKHVPLCNRFDPYWRHPFFSQWCQLCTVMVPTRGTKKVTGTVTVNADPLTDMTYYPTVTHAVITFNCATDRYPVQATHLSFTTLPPSTTSSPNMYQYTTVNTPGINIVSISSQNSPHIDWCYPSTGFGTPATGYPLTSRLSYTVLKFQRDSKGGSKNASASRIVVTVLLCYLDLIQTLHNFYLYSLLDSSLMLPQRVWDCPCTGYLTTHLQESCHKQFILRLHTSHGGGDD